MAMTDCYLVYRSVNGKVTAEIQYGQHQTGEGVKDDVSELKRIELTEDLTLSQAMEKYSYETSIVT